MAGQGPPCGLDDDPDDGGRGRPGHSGRGAMTDPFSSEGSKAPPKPFTVAEGRRRVRSSVLRPGRFTPAQQRAFADLWPRFGLDCPGEPRDFAAVVARDATRVLELGFAPGEARRYSPSPPADPPPI